MSRPAIDDEIAFEVRLGDVNEAAIAEHLRRLWFGPGYRLGLFAGYLGAIALGAAILDLAVGIDMMSLPALATMTLLIWTTFGLILVIARRLRQMHRLVVAAPIRRLPVRYVVSARGIMRNGALTPWEMIVGVDTMPGMTLLLLSPFEAMPVPDTHLPTGVTSDALRRAIEGWRSA